MATPPDLNIPPSDSTVEVSIIDTTGTVRVATSGFFEPEIAGYSTLVACCHSFLIKRKDASSPSKYDTLLFDLGVRTDVNIAPKVITDMLKTLPPDAITVEKDAAVILQEGGVTLESVGGIVWSHHHFDHTGNPTLFPSSTDIIVGPGFKKAFVPAYPTVEDSPVDERLWEGRNLVEIDITSDLRIGGFDAYDFFGDGSFYLLHTPGHAVGHLSGLARTGKDEFIFMGGDIAHTCGEFRPTTYLPVPTSITPNPFLPPYTAPQSSCPGALFEAIHPSLSSSHPHPTSSPTTTPFFRIPASGIHDDPARAQRSIDELQDFDAHESVFVAIAHDRSIQDVVEYFPKVANGWREKGWKGEGRWRFLREFGGL